ncbi:immunogenic MPT64 domain protein [Mycobacterium xenopi 4042]|uniref:Immunogenic MPT64 domain protein n=1 Tax=Mycobacterium xenopi 4042 TaxID=1299334 RepID=X8CM52_MYCXE|nr:immunogenic MPT64 domain protein [Mycobacterium xenopi 4042]
MRSSRRTRVQRRHQHPAGLPRPEVGRRIRLADARWIPQRGQVWRAPRYPV